MIAKIVKGKGFRGALDYLFRSGRATIIGGNLLGRTPRELAAEFGQFRKLRPALAKAVVHVPVSAHPEDRVLSDAEMAEIAERITEGLGYGESPCVFVRHNDTDHQHMHLLLCRVDRHGKSVSDSNDYRRAEGILRKIERDYRLKEVESPGVKPPKQKKNKSKEHDMKTRTDQQHEPAEPFKQAVETDDQLTMTSPETSKPGNAGVRFKREARRNALTDDYEQQLRALWGESFRLYRHSKGLVLYFDKPKQIRDEGGSVSAKGMREGEAAEKLVALALAKGWKGVSFSGTPSFVKEAMRQAMQAGLDVGSSDEAQKAWIDELRAEFAFATLDARIEPSTNSLMQRLHERRHRLAQIPLSPTQPTGGPRHEPN